MEPLVFAISETLVLPDTVVQSNSNPNARLYYREYRNTHAGDKYVCVVVIILDDDAFVVSAYLRERVREGTVLWEKTQ